jgi:DNA invertase Pin-like site-specific DNA recombinase
MFVHPGELGMKSAVAYYRVSTQRQGRSGLGLEAQRTAVARFAEAEAITLISEFTEVETGKGADALDRRPQLASALQRARRSVRSWLRSSIAFPATSPSLPG